MEIELRSDFDVELVAHMGSDELICKAARVSTLGAESIDTKESAGLINFLMHGRHGSPFEHSTMMFRISAPIFVWREYMRHRIGFSYNEESGRYKQLDPVFYIPSRDRNLIQRGKPGAYEFIPGTSDHYAVMERSLTSSYERAWEEYQIQLEVGIAKEVARMCLPVAVYSTVYVTLNPRSMMSFLSLRTKDPASKFPSFPMHEINKVADEMEKVFADLFPITQQAFCDAGRVSP